MIAKCWMMTCDSEADVQAYLYVPSKKKKPGKPSGITATHPKVAFCFDHIAFFQYWMLIGSLRSLEKQAALQGVPKLDLSRAKLTWKGVHTLSGMMEPNGGPEDKDRQASGGPVDE